MRQKAAPKSRLVGLFLLQYRQSGLVLGYTTAYLAPRCGYQSGFIRIARYASVRPERAIAAGP